MKLSVVILAYNGGAYLPGVLRSLQRQVYSDFDVFIADNGSTDASIESVTRDFPYVKVIRLGGNLGFAAGYNRALSQLDSEYVFLLNQDTECEPHCLDKLMAQMSSDGLIGACGSKLLFYERRDKINHYGGRIMSLGGGYDLGFGEPDEKEDESFDTGYVCGAAMMMRNSVFNEAGGFDEDLFMYGEDVDLCWRFWLLGYRVRLVPASIVYHKTNPNHLYESYPRKVFLNQRNRLICAFKNFEPHNVFAGLFLNVIATLAKAVKSVFRLQLRHPWWLLKAYCDFFRLLPSTLKKREYIQRRRKLRDTELFNSGVIEPIMKSVRTYKRW